MQRLAVLASVIGLGVVTWGAGALLSAQTPAPAAGQPAPINPANFTGLVTPHATTDIRTLRYEFARGARTNWHSHAGGQVVFIERGRMLTQERGKAVQEFGPGALIRTEPNVVHWHGARPDEALTQVALSFGVTNWLQPVTDGEYSAR
jgi:quercetin dioxygenase-like cupin family protein